MTSGAGTYHWMAPEARRRRGRRRVPFALGEKTTKQKTEGIYHMVVVGKPFSIFAYCGLVALKMAVVGILFQVSPVGFPGDRFHCWNICGCGGQNRFGIPIWLVGEFTTHFRTDFSGDEFTIILGCNHFG